MTAYKQMEREFIERTIEIVDQYHEKILGAVPPDDEREVTLLLNSLLALLVYPQQLAGRGQVVPRDWLTNDKVVDIGPQWGIDPQCIKYAGYTLERDPSTLEVKLKPTEISALSMRQLLRNMRNCTAHAGFRALGDSKNTGQIQTIIFEADPKDGGFYMELPVSALETLVRSLSQSALNAIDNQNARLP